jgi:hypothetical protein
VHDADELLRDSRRSSCSGGSWILPVDLLRHDRGLADRHLVALAPHHLDEDRSCSSPRPETWNASAEPVSSTRMETFVKISFQGARAAFAR